MFQLKYTALWQMGNVSRLSVEWQVKAAIWFEVTCGLNHNGLQSWLLQQDTQIFSIRRPPQWETRGTRTFMSFSMRMGKSLSLQDRPESWLNISLI
jgi:hypothetical protein